MRKFSQIKQQINIGIEDVRRAPLIRSSNRFNQV